MKGCIFIFLLALLLPGCSDAPAASMPGEVPQQEETFFRESSADHHDPRWTKQELLTAFYQYAEEGTVVVDCVVLEETVWDVAGVVQYTRKDEPGCWFDFIKSQGIPRSAGVESLPAGEGTLLCAGADCVSCTLLEEDGTEYTCMVSYYEKPENRETGFKIATG